MNAAPPSHVWGNHIGVSWYPVTVPDAGQTSPNVTSPSCEDVFCSFLPDGLLCVASVTSKSNGGGGGVSIFLWRESWYMVMGHREG